MKHLAILALSGLITLGCGDNRTESQVKSPLPPIGTRGLMTDTVTVRAENLYIRTAYLCVVTVGTPIRSVRNNNISLIVDVVLEESAVREQEDNPAHPLCDLGAIFQMTHTEFFKAMHKAENRRSFLESEREKWRDIEQVLKEKQ